jgi:transposase
MAPSTPSQNKHHYEADTVKKTRFFHAIVTRASTITIKDVCEAENISHGTGKEWLKQRKRLGDAASRRIEKSRSGRSKKVSSDLTNKMLDPQQISVRDQPWPAQIEHFQLDVAPRTLRAAFN